MEDWQDTLKLLAKASAEIHDVSKEIRGSLKKRDGQDSSRVVAEKKHTSGKSKAGSHAVGVLTAVGAATALVGIGYALYRYLMPSYLNTYNDDDYKDDFDDYFEDEEMPAATAASTSADRRPTESTGEPAATADNASGKDSVSEETSDSAAGTDSKVTKAASGNDGANGATVETSDTESGEDQDSSKAGEE